MGYVSWRQVQMSINQESRTRSPFGAGVVAMTTAVILALLGGLLSGLPTLPEIIGGHLVTLIPGEWFEVGIQTLGPLAKKVVLVLLMLGQILIGGGLALYLSRWKQDAPHSVGRTVRSLSRGAVGAFIMGGLLTLLLAG